MNEFGWQERAACRGLPLVLFFGREGERGPEKDARVRAAKAVCAGCPVRAECLRFALERNEKHGVWGLDEDERYRERRRRMRREVAVAAREQVSV